MTWTNLENIKWNKPDRKGQMLYDSTYKRYLALSDLEKQKVEWWSPGTGGGNNRELMSTVFQFGMIKKFWKWWCLYNNVNVLYATELHN